VTNGDEGGFCFSLVFGGRAANKCAESQRTKRRQRLPTQSPMEKTKNQTELRQAQSEPQYPIAYSHVETVGGESMLVPIWFFTKMKDLLKHTSCGCLGKAPAIIIKRIELN
jgi:hypothetical protein